MRLITFEYEGMQRIGAWIDDDQHIVDFALADSGKTEFTSMQALIESGAAGLALAQDIVAAAPSGAIRQTCQVCLLAPLPRPLQIRDCLCFPGHLKGVKHAVSKRLIAEAANPAAMRAELEAAGYFDIASEYYEFPLYYIANNLSVVGSDTDIVWPEYSKFIDYELEWAAVIGQEVRKVDAGQSGGYIFGYTIYNDWSARDEQARVMNGVLNLGPSSGKDFCNSIGPCIVTADELLDPYNLAMRCYVNGALVSEGNTSEMHWRFEDLVAHLTRSHSLYPGEIIGSGTVGGGCAIEAGITLESGDSITLEIEGIGKLSNRVLADHMASGGTLSGDLASSMRKLGK